MLSNRIVRTLERKFAVEQTVLYGLLWRGVQIVSGPITLLLIAWKLSPEVQGYYYTFGSLVALQSFFELGLLVVLLNVAAHEWSGMSLDIDGRISGDRDRLSRLVSLGRFVFKYYSGMAGLFVAGVLFGGLYFLGSESTAGVAWRLPWMVLVAVAGFNFVAAPFVTLLEGCGQVTAVYRMRAVQVAAMAVCGWVVIAFGGELWAAVAVAAVQLAANLYFLLCRYRRFFEPFAHAPAHGIMSWKCDIWPMQWRLGCSGIVNYFALSLFTPVMFHYHGALEAGRMGMTQQITSGLQSIALLWIQAKVPLMGRLINRQEFGELDREWRRAAVYAFAVYLTLSLMVLTAVWVIGRWQIPFAAKILSAGAVAGFLVGGALMNLSQSMSAYLRAHKREPILIMSVCTSIATGLAVWWLGPDFGAPGIAWGYAAVMAIGVIWQYQIWLDSRRQWHAAPTA